jgi:hypothetical protein
MMLGDVIGGGVKRSGAVIGAVSEAQQFTNGIKIDALQDISGAGIALEDDLLTDRWTSSVTNTFLGAGVLGAGNLAHGSGVEGWYNTAVGALALNSTTTGYANVAIGYSAGEDITSGNLNSFIGYQAGRNVTTGIGNIAIGYQALNSNTTGSTSTAVGRQAGFSFTGSNGLFFGYQAGYSTSSGNDNVMVGFFAGYSTTTGSSNSAIGSAALFSNTNGIQNTAIGMRAGYAADVSGCVYIGYFAGYNNSRANTLYIDNSNSTAPLLYGEFDNDTLTVNDYLYQKGTYAEIHVHDNEAAQTISSGASYSKLTHFADNGAASNCTADAANDQISFSKTGYYLVNGSFSFECDTNNVEWKMAAFLNGVEQDQIHLVRKIGTAGDVGSASFTGLIDVTTAAWDLDVRGRHDNGGSVDLTVVYANLNVLYLGDT